MRLSLVCLFVTLSTGRSETVELTATADTCLFEWTADYNFGAQVDLPAGGLGGAAGVERLARALFRFDIAAAVPAGAVVDSATMRLHVTERPTGGRASTFALNRVLVLWSEGNKSGERPGGSNASAGESTWNNRVHPTTPWAEPGGQFGSDYASTTSASSPNVDAEGDYLFFFGPAGLSDLEQMAASPDSNHGWVLWSQAEGDRKTARRWASREATSEPVPILEINWSPPVAVIHPPAIAPDDETFDVVFTAVAGFTYQLETLASDGTWLPGPSITPDATGPYSFSIPLDVSGSIARIATRYQP